MRACIYFYRRSLFAWVGQSRRLAVSVHDEPVDVWVIVIIYHSGEGIEFRQHLGHLVHLKLIEAQPLPQLVFLFATNFLSKYYKYLETNFLYCVLKIL